MLSIGTGSYPAPLSHSRNAARSPGFGQATPILIGFEAIAPVYSKPAATKKQAQFLETSP
jgi:hypothetical protein